MNTPQIILGILAFALVTAVLYTWGLHKSMTQQEDLERILLSKSARKVVNYLKKHESISLEEMGRLCKDVKAGQFWSRKKAAVQNPRLFAPKLAQYMTEQLLVKELPGNRFCLR
ncbi:hypothetical protein DWX58_11350 [Pseudoflavonifractor sp. AF19-9AC]|uniref:hypothetical protein n=1 Tax=Pseudoflavonifractor sp. AF19-9AC TaxID=2292244 RepID=UPI000E555B30|nr:hypothetical protein [Pseudoflavonifractor sp. AF19-9AC]RHR07444.1 hypothetical protein DWX58_11350 [Pseudoflavonifractor sp. AF19-9AC]